MCSTGGLIPILSCHHGISAGLPEHQMRKGGYWSCPAFHCTGSSDLISPTCLKATKKVSVCIHYLPPPPLSAMLFNFGSLAIISLFLLSSTVAAAPAPEATGPDWRRENNVARARPDWRRDGGTHRRWSEKGAREPVAADWRRSENEVRNPEDWTGSDNEARADW